MLGNIYIGFRKNSKLPILVEEAPNISNIKHCHLCIVDLQNVKHFLGLFFGGGEEISPQICAIRRCELSFHQTVIFQIAQENAQ